MKGDYFCVSHILRHAAFHPAASEKIMNRFKEGCLTLFNEIRSYFVTTWNLARGKSVNSLAKLRNGRHLVKFVQNFMLFHSSKCKLGNSTRDSV